MINGVCLFKVPLKGRQSKHVGAYNLIKAEHIRNVISATYRLAPRQKMVVKEIKIFWYRDKKRCILPYAVVSCHAIES